jgi:hypothetical protein
MRKCFRVGLAVVAGAAAAVTVAGTAGASGWNPQPKQPGIRWQNTPPRPPTRMVTLLDTAKAVPADVTPNGTVVAGQVTVKRAGTRITASTAAAARGRLVTGRRVLTQNVNTGQWVFTATFGCSVRTAHACDSAFVEGGIAPYTNPTGQLADQRLYAPGLKHGGFRLGTHSWSGWVPCGRNQVDAYLGKPVARFDRLHNYNSRLLAGGLGDQPAVPYAAIDKNPNGTARITGGVANAIALVVTPCAGTPITLEAWRVGAAVGYPAATQRRFSIDDRPAAAGWNYRRTTVPPFDVRTQVDLLHGHSAGVRVKANACGETVGFPAGFRGYQAAGVPGGTPGAFLDSAGSGTRVGC